VSLASDVIGMMDESLPDVQVLGSINGIFCITLGGKRYCYKPGYGVGDASELESEFRRILAISSSRALEWINQPTHGRLVYGTIKNTRLLSPYANKYSQLSRPWRSSYDLM